ncbi:MAG: sarcosine oxidase subunit delta [Gammaproteobacteria bacterium]|nr:sarcosine oxidase subunit delta [Gammaproteobacteria bacterium]
MKIMHCPLNGPRNISEFTTAGEVGEMPDPRQTDDAQWAAHVWVAYTRVGVVKEWWCHAPTSYWFIAERNTVTDEILRTYPASEIYRERKHFGSPEDHGV